MAVRALLHYALEVPDQTVGEKFYRSFGLVDEAGRDGAVRLRPAPLKRESVLLYGGPRKRLHHLAFGAPGDDYQATAESIRRAGVPQVGTSSRVVRQSSLPVAASNAARNEPVPSAPFCTSTCR